MKPRWQTLFNEHPRSVGETYAQHMRSAFSFGGAMLLGSLVCLVHGVFPWIWKSKGSQTIGELHERMIRNRARPR